MDYQKAISQLKLHEGFRAKPYRCTEGYLTVGYGTNLDTRGISEDEAEELLLNDMCRVEQSLERHGLLVGLNGARCAVLINMGYQLGINGLLKFEKTLNAVEAGQFELAAKEMIDSRWAEQTPSRAKELAEQMRTGEYQ